MSLAEMRSILEASPARRVEPGRDVWLIESGPWWKIFRSFPSLKAAKLRILEAAWRLPLPLFLLPEEPIAQELTAFVKHDPPAWRLDKARTAEAFYNTEPASGLGNWQLYAANSPVAMASLDSFRTRPDALLQVMRQHGIQALIDVFHDDTDWCVALLSDK